MTTPQIFYPPNLSCKFEIINLSKTKTKASYMYYLYLKATHVIFIVTWFAGMFYIVRLFVYYAEAEKLVESEKDILQRQYKLMQRRLWYGITWPSAIITAILGTLLAVEYGSIPDWLWAKIGFVIFLYIYQCLCHLIFLQQQNGINKYSSVQLRFWNEVATIFLVSIVFLVILKNLLSMLYGLVGLIVFSLLLMSAILIYRKIRS